MLIRKVEKQLAEWKQTKVKKCLIVQGSRQVGKTFSIRKFAKERYKELLEINFKLDPGASEIFAGKLDADTLVTAMRLRFPQLKIQPGKTLIFLDEIQECPEAITSLKFWTEDNKYDVIASGSLLGIDYKRASSYPVGYVNYLKMYALDFEEFLWNMGVAEDIIAKLKSYFDAQEAVPEAINSQMMEYFRLYLAIGGMPAVVWQYLTTKDFRDVDRVQRELVQDYQYDIAHYATAEEKVKAEKCFLSLSKQLLDKENHKFQYKDVEKGGRGQKYFSSIEWLLKGEIIHCCNKVSDIKYDLADYEDESFFRAYTADLSLLIGMKDFAIKQQIVDNKLSGNTKGGLYECAIADILYKKEFVLYFYKNETTRKEVDFIIQKDGNVIPIEVKSGNTRATSLNKIFKKWPEIGTAYKFIDGNMGKENNIITAPLYMAMFM
ncbi:MAG: ATP-binding protein [Spirochaetia bacterium]|nr:ATP-binding protein [Spirochaetia bacterium]